MAFKKKIVEFNKAELTAEWVKLHQDHNPLRMRHTVFDGDKGIEYEEFRCYTCKETARKAIGTVNAIVKKVEKSPKSEMRVRGQFQKRTFEEYCEHV